MNGKMWLHPATQENVKTLKSRGAEFIGPDEGMLVVRLRRHRPPVAGGKDRGTRVAIVRAEHRVPTRGWFAHEIL